jgi:hypothetical protein
MPAVQPWCMSGRQGSENLRARGSASFARTPALMGTCKRPMEVQRRRGC